MVGPGDIQAVVLAIGDDRGDQREIGGWVAGGSIDVVGVEELLDQVGKMEEDGRGHGSAEVISVLEVPVEQ